MSDPDLSSLIHTLRNQLNNIAMSAELAKMELSTADSEFDPLSSVASAVDCLESILKQCQESAELVSTIADPRFKTIAE